MSQNYSKDSLDRFGDDLCEELLSYLSFKDRFRWESVSKQWRRVIFKSQSVFKIEKKSRKSLKRFETILTKCPNITRVYCENDDTVYLSNELIECLINDCNHLTDISVNVSNDCHQIIDEFLAKFGKQLKTISLVPNNNNLYNELRDECYEKCVNLTEIWTSINDTSSKIWLVLSAGNGLHYKRLNSLHLDFYGSDDNSIDTNLDAFESFARNYGHNIKTIELKLHFQIDDNMVNKLSVGLSRMPALIALKVYKYYPQLLSQISPKCPQLKSISIEMLLSEQMKKILQTINANFKQLKRLKITVSDRRMDNLSSDLLNELKQLTHFKLSIGVCISDTFFSNIDHNWPQLLNLRLNRVIITDEMLNALSRLTQIRCIQFRTYFSDGIDAKTVEDTLRKNCPHITSIRLNNYFNIL